jgi:hypothetical protein
VLNIRYRLASQEDGLSKKLTAGNSTDLIPGILRNPYPGGVKQIKTTNEMAIYLWKRLYLMFSIDYAPGITCWEEIKKLFQKFPVFTSQVMAEYDEKGLNSELPILMVAKEYLESLSSDGEKSYEITRFLDEKYKYCGARWSAGGTYCCATAGATALINQTGEIFAYRLGWSDSMGRNGNSQTFPASEITSVTEALENFNHFGGECWSDTRYTILPREDWRIVERKFKAYQEAKKVRLDREARTSWREGEAFSFGITTRGGWYKPSSGVGLRKIVPQHEHDDSRTQLGTIKIIPGVPYGSYQFYVWGYPVSLTLERGKEPYLSLCASSSWCNSQSWWLDHHDSTNIERGWFFVDDKDVYESTIQKIKEKKAEKLAVRNTKFVEAKADALEAGFTETQVSQIIKLASKGQVISMLSMAKVLAGQEGVEFVMWVISDPHMRGKSPVVIENYSFLLARASSIKLSSAKKAAKMASAWSYLRALIPGYGTGYFQDAMEALNLALANKVPFKNGNIETFGGENIESDFSIKLREAGLTAE